MAEKKKKGGKFLAKPVYEKGWLFKSLLGLVCDPIAGLVEVPCVKRNAAGAMVAMCSADMALAGIRSAVPPDEVILAMRDVGDKMDVSLRDTGLGGVAGTPFGIHIAEKLGVDN